MSHFAGLFRNVDICLGRKTHYGAIDQHHFQSWQTVNDTGNDTTA